MIDSLDMIEKFIILQSEYYEMSMYQKYLLNKILEDIYKLRKDILKNEEYTELDNW